MALVSPTRVVELLWGSVTKNERVAIKVAEVARQLAVEKKARLDHLKAKHSDCERSDFLWHYLLQSFATMGGSAGWAGLIGNKANYSSVTFKAVENLPASDRNREILKVCRAAKLRWPERKAGYIVSAHDRIRSLGGLDAANKKLFAAHGREAKMKFLKSFTGIGDKYARNMMMDVYHEDFRSSIAIDSRIKGLSERWGLSFVSYVEHERFYLGVARDAGLNGWELDRLLYNFHDEFVTRVHPE
jgi:thermostable 8-oxoguanine DNA glycosylase